MVLIFATKNKQDRMKESILIIPDVHGRSFWKEAVESGDYEKVVFLGDYTDPYQWEGISEEDAIDNFLLIIEYKEKNPDRVVLLLGNHDLHYYSEHFYELTEGSRYNALAAVFLQCLFQDNSNLFQLTWETDWGNRHYLFSHAGITQSWLKRNNDLIGKPDAQHLNHLVMTDEGLESLAQVGEIRFGDYPSGSIVWADSDELAVSDALPGIYQIVGHTQQINGPVITDKFACLDCRAAFSLDQKGRIIPVTDVPQIPLFF